MKKRTDFVTNSSSTNFMMAWFLAIFPVLGMAVGPVAGRPAGSTAAALDASIDAAAAAQPGTVGPQGPKPRTQEVAWGGDAYILSGPEAHDWLTERGLMANAVFTEKFWNQWGNRLPSELENEPFGLHAVGGDWSMRDQNQRPGYISILIDNPNPPAPEEPGKPQDSAEQPRGDEQPAAGPSKDAIEILSTGAGEPEEQPEEEEKPDEETSGPSRRVRQPGTVVKPLGPQVPVTPPKPGETPPKPEEKPAEPPKQEPEDPLLDQVRQEITNYVKDRQDNLQTVEDRTLVLDLTGDNGGTFTIKVGSGKVEVTRSSTPNPNFSAQLPRKMFDIFVEGVGLWDVKYIAAEVLKGSVKTTDDGTLKYLCQVFDVKLNPLVKPIADKVLG